MFCTKWKYFYLTWRGQNTVLFEHQIGKKICKHHVNGVHNITIFRREQKAAVPCRLPMNYGCGSRPLATFCYNVNFFSFLIFLLFVFIRRAVKHQNPGMFLKYLLGLWRCELQLNETGASSSLNSYFYIVFLTRAPECFTNTTTPSFENNN